MSEAKTVAIIGAGPVGLAAAAHVLERGLAADRAGSRRPCRPRHAAMGPRPAVLAMGIQHRQGGSAAAGGNGLEFSRARISIRPALKSSSAISNRSPTNTALKPHIHTSSRVTGISRVGFDKLKTKGRETAPFEIRYQNGQGPKVVQGRRGHRRFRHLAFAEPGRRQRPARHRRDGGRGPDRLRHARCAGQRPRALCRQDRRGAGRRSFRDRHADRSRKTRARSAGDPAGLAVARQRSRQGLWRRRQRQAGRPRRTRCRLCRAGDGGPDQGGKRISRFASHRRRPSPRRRRALPAARPVRSSSTNSSSRRVSARTSISCASCASGSIRRSSVRSRWRR